MEKSSRPQRNRRHSRRAWPPEDDLHQPRPTKRLFTPEIKRMLKDWLVRRRENPYPSRDEKKRLAIDAGLTYTQICNWFANWRRKLKNSKNERAKKSWGHLIKNYNTNAKGNVEQFSISSEDSIWEEEERFGVLEMVRPSDDDCSSETDTVNKSLESSERHYYDATCKPNYETVKMEHSNYYYPTEGGVHPHTTAQCYQISSTTTDLAEKVLPKHGTNLNLAAKTFSNTKAKYKQKMMEKYLRDMHVEEVAQTAAAHKLPLSSTGGGEATELSKWLESAAKFTPDKNNYFIEWSNRRNKLDKNQCVKRSTMPHNSAVGDLHVYDTIHHEKDELEAAEALANFAFNCRQRWPAPMPPLNAISS